MLLSKSLKKAVSHPRCRYILWLELRSHSQSGGVLAVSRVPLHTVNHLPSLRVDFLSVCQSFTEIHCGRISLFIPTPTPISVWILPTFLLGPWPVSNRVRNLLAWRPLVQIQSMLVWPRKKNDPLADHSIKMDLLSAFQWHTSRTITQTNPAGTGTEMEAWTVSWIQMETGVTQPWIYQSTYSHTSFSAV